MALKGHRNYDVQADEEISYFFNEVTERGIIVVYPDGNVMPPGLDDANNVARIPTSDDDGCAIGLLAYDVVDKDLTDCCLNKQKCETQVGAKVLIFTGGWHVTDQIAPGVVPTPGAKAYYAAGGQLSDSGTHEVGKFESNMSEDGFVRVRLNIS